MWEVKECMCLVHTFTAVHCPENRQLKAGLKTFSEHPCSKTLYSWRKNKSLPKDMFPLLVDRGRGEKPPAVACQTHTNQGLNLQSRHVPWLGIGPTVSQCMGQCSTNSHDGRPLSLLLRSLIFLRNMKAWTINTFLFEGIRVHVWTVTFYCTG